MDVGRDQVLFFGWNGYNWEIFPLFCDSEIWTPEAQNPRYRVPSASLGKKLFFFIPKIHVFWKQVKFQKMFSHYKKFASLDSLGFWKTLFDDIANLNFPFKNWKTRKIYPPPLLGPKRVGLNFPFFSFRGKSWKS